MLGLSLSLFISHRHSSIGEVSLSTRSHVAWVFNHRKVKRIPLPPEAMEVDEKAEAAAEVTLTDVDEMLQEATRCVTSRKWR